MLLRAVDDGRIAITQPAHARLSGDLARAWGNEGFLSPNADEILAASLHDIGWLGWELNPDYDEATKLPRVFADMPTGVHMHLWDQGVACASTIGRLIGVLVSLHAETIYEKWFDFSKAAPENAQAVRTFLARQNSTREELLATLRTDHRFASAVTPERLTFARRLIATVDFMSLLICWGLDRERRLEDVPQSLEDACAMSLTPQGKDILLVAPWPFKESTLRVSVEGRRLPSTLPDKPAMRQAFAESPYVTLECLLMPGARLRR
jgi:Protein of unknown function (DUF3891)